MSRTDGNASFLRAARAGNLEKVLDYLKGSTDINTSNANGLNALHLASKEGHVNVVTELLKRGANVGAATKKGNTALHIASLAGQEEIVKILVQHGAAVNVQSQNGFTPLYMAAQENHSDVVKFLLANGANQSLATEDGFTPLAVALQQGHDKVVTVLLENDSRGKVRLPALHIAAKKDDCKAAALLLQNDHNPDVTSKSGFTPLHIAAHYGNENIAVLLLERAADVNFAARHNITPLHVAAKWGKANMVTLLLDKGAEIDAKTRDGLTALHCAARSGHDNVVDLLLEKGAPIVAKTKNGLAPLHMASQGDHVDSARILLYHKAPVDDVTVDYLTALHVAAHCGHVRVAKLLLDRKADANARALNGFTPLHIACKKNRIKVVELLLKHGASIEATTESGLTPLHVASFMGCMNIVIYLIQHGASPDVPTVRGETPLHLAARANQTDIIRILLRNGAHVDARAREQQTPLHIASRLGNTDIVVLLLQHGASVDAVTKDLYTPLHIAAKEGQEEVASILLEHGASLTATTQKGFTPLHLAAKYGNMKVARLLLQRDAPVDAQGKNGLTPLHVAAHYDHVNVALLLLDKGASPHAAAKNGYTPLHIAAKKNQMDIATTLLEYGAKPNAESKAGFTPLHLSSQEGHTDMASLLIEHHGDVNAKAKNGLTPLHLCAQEERVNVAAILVKNGAEIDPSTKAGYTPLHVACHFGQINMIRFLLQHNANVNAVTALGYTPLHQAAQQGHTLIINLLLQHKASPNAVTNQGQTPLSIAQRLGYISVVETLKVVTETIVTTTTTTIIEEKYKVVSPETMQEVFISDSEDEGAGEETLLGDMSFRYLSTDDRDMHDDSADMQDSRDMSFGEGKLLHDSLEGKDFFGRNAKDERIEASIHQPSYVAYQNTVHHGTINPKPQEYVGTFTGNYIPDNVDISRQPVYAGKLKWKTFLVSFMVDARGGAMRGCRHSGVRVIIPPRRAPMPMRITCRYLKKEKLLHPPPLMEGEALASRVLEMGPSGAKFLGPVIIEIPHFASLRGKEREIMILRSDNGESWREHTLEASEEAVQEVLNESFDGDELSAIEDLNTTRITRILTTDFPQYFAIVTRIRQEVHAIGPEGGMVSSTVVPQVQAVFPEGALTKKIKVGLQAQPIPSELVAKMLGNRVAVSPIVTVEPRRRKFHKPITLTIPVPQAASKGMINQYSGEAPTLRLLCSITGGTTPAQWEDITGTTPLTFVNDCVSFTTTVSARFWLMDCRQVNEAAKFASDLYREAIMVPFMAKFVVFAKRHDMHEAKLRAFCMTDDKEDKTLENQEHFIEVAKSRDVEVLDSKPQYVEFAGNLIPVTKSGEQLHLNFHPFHENRLPFIVRVKDPHQDAIGRIAFMREPKVGRGEPPQTPLCNLTIKLPGDIQAEQPISEPDLVTLEKRYTYIKEMGIGKPETITKANLRLTDIANQLENDWVILALQLDITESEINKIKSEHPEDDSEQALAMLRLWLQKAGPKATGNNLEKSLRKINREDIVKKCMFNVELVTDDMDRAIDMVAMDQSGFEAFKEELGPSRDASLRRDTSLDVSYDEGDMSKDGEIGGIDHVFIKEQPTEDRIQEKHMPRKTKTPPPTPVDKEMKEYGEIYDATKPLVITQRSETTEIDQDGTIRKSITTITTETTAKSFMQDDEVFPEQLKSHVAAKLAESETFQSEDMDASIGDEPYFVQEKEWTETGETGFVKRVVKKVSYSSSQAGQAGMTASQVFDRDLIKDKDKEAAFSSVEGFDSETDIDKQSELSKTLPIGGTSREVGEMEEDFEFIEIPESLQLDDVPDISKLQESLPETIGKSDALEKKVAVLDIQKGEKDFKAKNKEDELDHSEDEKEKDEMESEFLLVSSIPDKKKPHDESPDDSGGPTGLSMGFTKDSIGLKESITEQFKESGESVLKPSDHKGQPQDLDQDMVIISDFEYDSTTTDSINVSKKIQFFEQKIIKKEFIHDEKEDKLEKETIEEHFLKSTAEVKKSEDLIESDKIQTYDETKGTEIKSNELLLSHEYIAMSEDEPTDQNERLVEQKLEEIFKRVDKDAFQDAKEMEETIAISEDPFTHKSLKQPAMVALFASQIPMVKEEFIKKYEEKLIDSVTEKTVQDSLKCIEGTSDFVKQETEDAHSLQLEDSDQESDTEETIKVPLQDVDISKEIGTTLKQAALAAMFVVKDSDKESEEEKEASEDSEKGSVTMKQAFMAARFITKDSDKDSVSLESDEEKEEIDKITLSKPITQSLYDKKLIEELPPKSYEEIDEKSVQFRKQSDIKKSTKELFSEGECIDDDKEPIFIEKSDKIKLEYGKDESKEDIEQFTRKHITVTDKIVTDDISESSQKKEDFEPKTDIDKTSVGMKTAMIATMFVSVKERDSESEEEKEVTVEKEIPEELEKSISIKHAAMAAMFISRESETSASSTDEEKEINSRKKDIDSEDHRDFETVKTMKESAIAALFVSKRLSPATVCVEDEEKEVTIEKEYIEESEKFTPLKETEETFIKKKEKDHKELMEESIFALEQSITEETSHVTIKQAALATVFIGKETISSQLFKESEISESKIVLETEEIFAKSGITSKGIVTQERIEQSKENKYVSLEEIDSDTIKITAELLTEVDDITKTDDSFLLDLSDKTCTTMKQAGLAAVFISKDDDLEITKNGKLTEEFLCQESSYDSSEIDSHKEISLKHVPVATVFVKDEMKTVKEDSEDTMSEEDMVEVAGLQKEINMKPAALAAVFFASETKFSSVHSGISDMKPSIQSDYMSTVTLPDKSLIDIEHLDIHIDPEMTESLDQDLDISEKELESDEEKEIDEAFGTASIIDPLIEEHQEKSIYLKQKMPIEIDKDVKFDLTEHLKELEKTVHYATSITGSLHSQQITSEISEMKLMKSEEAEKYKIKETDEFITAAISDVSDSMKGFFKESELESHLEEKVVEKFEKVISKTEEQSLEIKDIKTDLKESSELFQKQMTTKEVQKDEDQSPEKFVHETIESIHKIKCQEEQLISTFESGTLSMLDIEKTRNGDKVLTEDQFIVEAKKQEERIIEIIDEKSESEIDDGTEKFEIESPEDVKPVQKYMDTFLSDDEKEDNENEICAVAAELVAKVLEKTVDQLSSEQELDSNEEKHILYKSEILSTILESKTIEKELDLYDTKKDTQSIFAAMTNIPSIKQDTALRTVSPTPYEIVPELSSEKSEIVLTTTDAMQLPTALVTSQPPFLLEQPLVAEHVIVPPQTKEEAMKSQPLTESVSRVDQVLKTPIDVEERFPLPSSKETYHDIILEKHPPITKISPEEESSSSEEEISPVEEYPPTLGADMKIPVGVSPTEEKILSELPDVTQASQSDLIDKKIIVPDISQIKSETSTAKQDISRGYDSFMCYDNGAFVGEEQIDLEESMLERDEESDCVQQELEVTREILKRWEEEKAAKEIEPVESLYQFDYREESVLKQIKSEIFSEEMEQSIGTPSPEAKQIFKDSPEEIVAKHIRSEIFATEMEQSIDTPSPEQKEIFEEGEEETVARHIRSEIFAEEFNQSIETPSPERKEISQSLSSESLEKDESELTEMQREVVEKTVQQIIQSSAEICAEEASREMKISLMSIDKRPAEIELTEKSFNIAEEHTPEQVLWEVSVQEQIEPKEETEALISTKEPLSIDSQFSDQIHHIDDFKTSLDHFIVATVSSDVVALAIHGEKEDMSLEKQTIKEIEKHESRKKTEEFSKYEEQQIFHESVIEETRKFSSEGSEISGEDLEEKTDFHLSHEHVMSEITAQMYQHDIYESCESSDDDLKKSSDIQDDTLIEIQEKELLELDSTISKTDDKDTTSFEMHKEHKVEDNLYSSGRVQFKEDFDIESITKIVDDSESLAEEYEKIEDVIVSHHKSLSEPYDSSDSYKSYGDSSDKMTSDSHFYAFDTSSSHASQETAEGYMTCVTSQEEQEKTSGDASYHTPVTSQDSYKITVRTSQEDSYHTAHSSWSSSGVSDSSYDESAASSVASSYKSKYETSESETMLASDTETEERTSTPKAFEDKYFFEEELDSLHEVETSHSKTKSSFEDTLQSEFNKKYFDEALEAWCEAGKTEYDEDKDDKDDHPDSPFEIIDTAEIALYDDYTEPSALAAAALAGSVMETSQTSTTESFESLHAESEQISSMPSYSHINGPVEVDYYPDQVSEQRSRGVIEIELSSDSQIGVAVTTIETSCILEQSPDEPAISRTESGEYLSNELLDEYAEYSVSSESQPSSGGRLLSEGSDEMVRSFEQTQLLELTTQETLSTSASPVINLYAQSNGPVEVEYTPKTSPHFPTDEDHVKSVKATTESKDIQSIEVTAETVSESDVISDQIDSLCKPEVMAANVETKDDENTVYFGERYSDLEDMIDTQEELGLKELVMIEKHISHTAEDQSIFMTPDIPKQDEELSESSSSEQDIQNIQEIQELQEIQEMQEYIEIQQEQYDEVAGESEMFQYNIQRSYEEYSSTITEESEEIIEPDFEIDTTIQKELDERPISQAESIGRESEIHDSDDQRVWSELQFSDEHPDSEFKELSMQPSDIMSEKEIEDYERPATPEPSEEYEIKCDIPESEASTVVAEDEGHRDSHFAVSEYVSTITEESESRHERMYISDSKTYTVSEKKDSLHISGGKEQISSKLEQQKITSQSSVDIPDITITQHMSPEIDSDESLDLDIKKETADIDKVAKHSEAELVDSLTDSQEMESFEIIEKIDTDPFKDISSDDNFEIILKPKKVDEILEENINLSQFDDGGMVKISTDKLEEEELAALKELQEQIILETSEFVTEREKESEKLTHYSFEFVTSQQFSSIEENQEQEEYERAEQEYGQFAEFDSKSTPDLDSNNKRFFSKSGENDDVSVSSLQEFEGLEMEIRHQEMLSKNNGSDTDSQNGKRFWSRSGDHDDVSMSSLQEFEKLEQELTEEEKLDADKTYILEYKAVQTLKDHTTLETEKLEKSSQDSDINEYEKRMSEIDEIIRQAESNLESFEAELQQREHQQLCELKSTDTCSSQGTESSIVERSTIIDDSDGDGRTTLTMDTTEGEHIAVTRTVSGHSSASQISRESHGQSPTSLTPQCDSDSLKDRELDFEEQEFDSHFSRERDFDADSLQEKMMTDEDKDHEFDRDSLQAPEEIDQEFDDSLQEKKVDGHDYDRDSLMGSSATSAQLFEDDNTLEPSSSSATHATYQDNDSLQASVTSSLPLSSDDNAAMISSIDSLNAEQTITSITTNISSSTIIPNQDFDPEIYNVLVEHDPSNRFIDSEGNIHSETWYETVTQSYIDPEGNIRTITTYTEKDGTSEMAYHETTSDIAEELISSREQIKRAAETETDPQMVKVGGYDISSCPAEIGDYISEKRPSEEIVTITRKIHHIVDPGTMSKEQLSKILQQSEPQISKEEITDQMGNVTHTVVCKTTKVSEPMLHTFSGPDADQQMAEFLRKSKKMEWEDEDSELDKCAQIVMKKQVEFLTESPEKELTERTHEVVETSETTDEKGNIVRVVTRKVTHYSEPQIHKYSYSTEQEAPSSSVSLEDKFGAVSHESKIIKTTHLSESVLPTDDHTAPYKSTIFAPREGGLPLDSAPSLSSETLSHSEDCYYSGLEAVSTILSTQPSLDWSEPSHHASDQEYKVDASRPSIDEEGEVEVDITEHDDLRGKGWSARALHHRAASIDDDGKAEYDVTEHDWQFAQQRSEGGVTEPTDFMEPYERQVQIVKDEISGAPHMTSGASGVVTRTVTSTIRDGDQVTTTVTETTEGGEHDQQLQQSMREIIDQFMADPQTQQYYQQYTYEDQDEE